MTINFISNLKNLTTLKNRLEAKKAEGVIITPTKGFIEEELTWDYWIKTVEGCIKDHFAMDEVDYRNSPKEVKACWRGLKDKEEF